MLTSHWKTERLRMLLKKALTTAEKRLLVDALKDEY
tara:strand:- start:1124 stop:1231 length:108 start_codon:yes stop_codon:yes gene_type:complete